MIEVDPIISENSSSLLRDAIAYLLNALIQVQARKTSHPAGFTPLKPESNADTNGVSAEVSMPSLNETDVENRIHLSLSELEDSVLLNLAYVNLCLQNFLPALKYCEQVIQKEAGVSERNRFLAKTYATEARCFLNESKALDLSFYGAYDGKDLLPASRLVNIATVLIYQGDLAGAVVKLMQAFSLSPNDPDVLRGLMYVYLRQGKVKEALQLSRRINPSIQ